MTLKMGISISAYARHRGVSYAAVRKAILAGRIVPEADGTINPDKADREWALNSAPPKKGTSAKAVKVQAADDSATNLVTELPADGTSLLQARTINEVVKAQTNKVRLARLKGELVDRNQAIAHVFKLARTERDAWLNWPARVSAQIAARLSVDAHTLLVVLEAAVREHLAELGEMKVRID